MFVKFITVCIFVSFTQATNIIKLVEDEETSLICNYGTDCDRKNIIITDPEYGILITATTIDINGQNGDFLLIKSGTEIDDGLSGRIFTHHINKGQRQYISLTNEVFVYFHSEATNKDGAGVAYALIAQRHGELVQEQKDDPIICPMLPEYYQYITVNMTVHTNNSMIVDNTFRKTIADMGQNYVNSPNNNITLCEQKSNDEITTDDDTIVIGSNFTDIITSDNVHLQRVIQCPKNWPHEGDCYQFRFALVICVCEDTYYYGTYQLNKEHLHTMWKNAEEYFTDYSIITVSTFDIGRMPEIGIATIWSIIVILVIFYLIIGHIYVKFISKKTASMSSEKDIQEPDENPRESIISLPPHPLQSVPPLFHNDMSFYDPDSSSRFFEREDEEERDDMLIMDNLNLFAPKKVN